MIEVRDLCKDWKEFSLKDITLDVKKGEYFVILGPTGAGKTLLLETIAGFHIPDKGDVWIEGRDVTLIPPEKRKIGFIYQDYSLFPHLTVEQNIAFGLKLKRTSKSNTNSARLKDIMNWLKISHLAHRYPSTLSGGEQQKVAIARAIAIEPPILLLDEPLSALDPRTKDYLRDELKLVKKEFGITMVHVTHDQTEALVLADRIAVLMNGRLMQVGTPYEIFNKPLNEELADFVGVENILYGNVRNKENGIAEIEINSGMTIFAVTEYCDGAVRVFVRPEDITISKSKGDSSARNVMSGKIRELQSIGALTRVKLDINLVALITKQSREILGLQNGDDVYATFKATSVHVVSG
ncbi:MAG: tungstate ABC transporter ATP-binding protein WtpC [Methanocellales archaeon]|nr:tungstate ABC transporter ATP-binding protein WtpC [Methanocellales archaeon]MDD3291682.1 tungstate ABC transporter ATP-binding protein WtpC [Methanocellales archaeon]MDD5235032.1 tungstate ABC transporter ATP-binding protein WtpC [Methanocellales archaeon]MDD5485170.1 tungstate ABC transporter ATP-binding protein WtpC [Methanocellales archaeon]